MTKETAKPQAFDPQFSALMNAAVDGILLINSRGIIASANAAVETLLGYTQEELQGKNISILMPNPDKDRHDNYIRNYLNTGEARIIGLGREVNAQNKSGEVFPIYLSVGDYQIDDETHFVGIIHDLREPKAREAKLLQAEQEIRQLVSKLAHVSRVSVMGEMAANIAHEINQPLAAIATYAQSCQRLLASDEPKVDSALATLEKITQQSLRAAEIIKGIRHWVREKDTQRRRYALPALISEVIEIARLDGETNGIKLDLDIKPKSADVMVDPVQIQQVLLNLLRNAQDANAEHALAEDDTKISIHVEAQDEDRICVSVADRGAGILPSASEKLFDPFFTTKSEGMGMGLSICRTIVNAHGGELGHRPNPGGGTLFYFTLPTALHAAHEQGALSQ